MSISLFTDVQANPYNQVHVAVKIEVHEPLSLSVLLARRTLEGSNLDVQTNALFKLQNDITTYEWSCDIEDLRAAKALEADLLRAVLKTPQIPGESEEIRQRKIVEKIKTLVSRGLKTTRLIFSGRALGRYVFWYDKCWQIDETTIAKGRFKTAKKLRSVLTGEWAIGKRFVLQRPGGFPLFFTREMSETERDIELKLAGVPNIIKIYCNDTYKSKRRGWTQFSIEEFASEGSLASWDDAKWASYSSLQKLSMVVDIFRGVTGMHARGIVHNDIKLANIVFSKGQACLIDFGCSYNSWGRGDSQQAFAKDKEALIAILEQFIKLSSFPESIEIALEGVQGIIQETKNSRAAQEAYEELELIEYYERAAEEMYEGVDEMFTNYQAKTPGILS